MKLKYRITFNILMFLSNKVKTLNPDTQLFYANKLGSICYRFFKVRQKEARKNISIAFPNKSDKNREIILKNTYRFFVYSSMQFLSLPNSLNNSNISVNGEQYFVEDSVKEKLELITLPKAWFTRWVTDESINYGKDMTQWQIQLTNKYIKLTGNDYIYLGGEFHEDIKFVHFTHSLNKPHEWKDYDVLKYK